MRVFLQSVFGVSEPAPAAVAELQALNAETNDVQVMGNLVSVILKGDEAVIEKAKGIIKSLEPKMVGWGKVVIYDGAGLFDEVTVGRDSANCAA